MKECLACHAKVEELLRACPQCGGSAFLTSGEDALFTVDSMRKQMEASECNDRGGRMMGEGRFAEAEAEFRRVTQINPLNATAYGNIALALYKQGRAKEAIPFLEEALRINPDLEGAAQALTQFKAEAAKQSTRKKALPVNLWWRLPVAVLLFAVGLYLLFPSLGIKVTPWVWVIFSAVAVAAAIVISRSALLGGRPGDNPQSAAPVRPIVSPEEKWDSSAGVEKLLREHVARLSELFNGRADVREAQVFIRQVLAEDLLAFAVQQISSKLPDAMAREEILHEMKMFPDWFVAVTICPWLLPEEVKAHLEKGYLDLVNNLAGPAWNAPEAKNLVHWIYCFNGRQAAAHLTLMPNSKGPYRNAATVIAQDLLTPEERRQVGLPPI